MENVKMANDKDSVIRPFSWKKFHDVLISIKDRLGEKIMLAGN